MTRDRFITEVRACQGQLRRFLASLCGGDTARADDIAQDALVRAYVSSDRFIDQLRRMPEPAVALDAPQARRLADAAAADDAFRHEALQRALMRIPEKERTAIVLHYFEDLSVKEIAGVMQIPAGTVKYYLSVGRDHLKSYLRA